MSKGGSGEPCPCGSARPYAGCCEPFHRGGEAPTPEALMRSRYAAFVRGEVEYLVRTLHPDHEDRAMAVKELEARLRAHGKRARYAKLEVLDHDAPDADGVAHVLFRVTMRLDGKDASFAELSSFAHDGEGWRYVGGRTYPPSKAPARIADAST